MKTTVLTGALVALLTGIAIAIQSTISSRIGSIIGDVRTGIIINTMGGIAAGTLLIFSITQEGAASWKLPWIVVGITAISGILGVLIITGISFSLQRAGVAAGIASVILGQLILSFIIDSFGIGGVDLIPISFTRFLGILVTGAGVYLLLPN